MVFTNRVHFIIDSKWQKNNIKLERITKIQGNNMKFHILFAFSLLQICLTQQHYGGNQYLIYYNNLPMGIVRIQIGPMSYTAGVQPQAVNTPNGNAAQATATNQQKYGIFNKAFAVAIPKIRYNYQPVRSDFRRRIIFHSN